MIPTPIPTDLIEPNSVRRTFTAPDGDLLSDTIRPVDALIERHDDTVAIRCRLVLEDGELERLQAGAPVWLTMLGNLCPFDVQVEDS